MSSGTQYLWYRQVGVWQYKVAKAIKEGQLKREPCLLCGELNAQAHHADYDKPLDVVFLCLQHHRQFHERLRKQFLAKGSRRYSHRFHDAVLSEFKREFQEPFLPWLEKVTVSGP